MEEQNRQSEADLFYEEHRGRVKRSFEKVTEHHQMVVLLDEPEHKHLRFSSPFKSELTQIDIVTWPNGYVSVTREAGRVGYVFRTEFGLPFFVKGPNPDYWIQRVTLQTPPAKAYSKRYFEALVRDEIEESLGPDFQDVDFWKDVDDYVIGLSRAAEEHLAQEALTSYWYQFPDRRWEFSPDCMEWDLKVLSDSFLWICHAATYGVKRYFSEHASVKTEPETLTSFWDRFTRTVMGQR